MYVSKIVVWLVFGLLVALGVATWQLLRQARLDRGAALIEAQERKLATVKLLRSLHEYHRGTSKDGTAGRGWEIHQGLLEEAVGVPQGTIYTPLTVVPDQQEPTTDAAR